VILISQTQAKANPVPTPLPDEALVAPAVAKSYSSDGPRRQTPSKCIELIYLILTNNGTDNDMIKNLIALIRSLSVCAIPFAAIAISIVVLVVVKAPADLKYIITGGSTALVSVGTWILGRRRGIQKIARQTTVHDMNDVIGAAETGKIEGSGES
jgi:hypothetical protein